MPSEKKTNSTISVVHEICCGLDVHKKKVTACLMISDISATEQHEIVEFDTFTDDLNKLKDWLLDLGCPVVSMESTGPYWTPVYNVLEDSFRAILVNARHMKNVPGRKTDVSDSRWLAGLLRHGLIKASFVPPKRQRHWRDLTRIRKSYMQDLGDYKRRVHKLFQQANIKIDSVVSDLFGQTGRNLMKLLVSKDTSPTLIEVQDCLRGSLKNKSEELYRAVQGFFEDHQRYLLSALLNTIEYFEKQIENINIRISQEMRDVEAKTRQLQDVPGIGAINSHAILAEIGPTAEAFPTASALASWCGLSPGNNQSAGKRFSGKNQVWKNHLKTIMVEVAWAAIKTRGSYYRAKYYALRARLGPKKAIIAVAHRILKAVYHILKHGVPFKDLGEAYLLRRNRETKINYLSRQAALLGYNLVLTETERNDQDKKIFS
jgi:transposase